MHWMIQAAWEFYMFKLSPGESLGIHKIEGQREGFYW